MTTTLSYFIKQQWHKHHGPVCSEGQVSRSAVGKTDRPNLLGKKRISAPDMSLLLFCFMCHSYSKGNEIKATYALRAPLWEMVISETYYLTAVVSVWEELGLLLILRSLKWLVCSTKALQILGKRYQSLNKMKKLIKTLMFQWKWSGASATFNIQVERRRNGK